MMHMQFLFFFFGFISSANTSRAATATAWVNEEDEALWEHFQRGPTCVAKVLPRGNKVVQKFQNEFLATFFVFDLHFKYRHRRTARARFVSLAKQKRMCGLFSTETMPDGVLIARRSGCC